MDHERVHELFEIIYDWADGKSFFDTTFIDSLHEQYEQREFLSESQIQALENIVEKFNME